MNKSLKISLVVFTIISLIVLGAFMLYRSITTSIAEFPEYAKPEAVYAKYGGVIEDVRAAIEAGESYHDVAARIEKVAMPEDLIYLTLIEEDDDSFENKKLELVEKFNITSSSHFLLGETGHGKLNGVPVIIVTIPVNRYSFEACYLYFEVDKTSQTAPVAQ